MDSENHLQALVRRCQLGERPAFEELFRRFQPRLLYYLRRLDSGGDRADDVLQNVWVKVVGRIGSLRDRQAFVAWLYRIARNELYGSARVKDPFVELTDEHLELVGDNHEPVFGEEEASRVHEALGRLRPDQREILTLYFLEELSHDQIAGILGVRAGTVKSRIYYAKRSLRKELERNHG
jgi:RNA polymerase sigma-70 factor, ECF subfamily